MPTEGQERFFEGFADFLGSGGNDHVFVLKGFAGTGKTSIVRTLVKTLPQSGIRSVLLAPTGRAAKVMSAYSGQSAFTIHKKIYFSAPGTYGATFSLKQNKHSKTLFIVDEASMIGGDNPETEHNLLSDLIEYVRSGEQCRLLLIGDTAQLPPVGLEESPALDEAHLRDYYFLEVHSCLLSEVMRQDQDSGILYNASSIRNQIEAGNEGFPTLVTDGFTDFKRIEGADLEDALHSAYGKYGAEEVLVITRSNKSANLYNGQIRVRVRWQESEISSGDQLMVVKNNYHWLPENSSAGFIANGDALEIQRLGKFYERGEFRFVDAIVRFADYDDIADLEVRLLLNSLSIEQASVPYGDMKRLTALVEEDYADVPLKRDRYLKMKDDPFLNALQVKFGFAVTCHKSQGGQWKCIFIDQGYLSPEMLGKNYLRWLYTAITRATREVYLVNFRDPVEPEF